MGLTVVTPAQTTDLTLASTVEQELGLSGGEDPQMERRIDTASQIIVKYCQRPFAREVYQETLPGYGMLGLTLNRTPIVAVSQILYLNEPVTDYAIDDPGAGLLYRRVGWAWTTPLGWSLDYHRPPDGELLDFTVSYTAGYLMPGDDVVSDQISVLAADSSFNLASGTFPLLVAGDVLEAVGFTNAANVGKFTVVSRSASKIVVAGSLTDEAPDADPRSLLVRTLPYDLEMAAMQLVKTQHFNRYRDPSIASKSIGELSLTFRGQVGLEGGGANLGWGLNPELVALLRPWKRHR